MGRRVVIGYASSRSEGLVYEQLLRDSGVQAFSEMGITLGEFSEASQCRLYADEENLTQENLDAVERILGNKAADGTIKVLRRTLPNESGAAEGDDDSVPIAWFDNSDDAEMYRGILRGHGVETKCTAHSGEMGESYGLFIRKKLLDKDSVRVLNDYLGDLVDKEIIDEAMRA